MTDWLLFIGSLLAMAWVLRGHYLATFPKDPPHWRAPGLSMSVSDGRIHFKQVKR